MKEVIQTGNRWKPMEANRQFYVSLYAIAGRPRLYRLIMRHLDMVDLYRQMAFALDHYFSNTIPEHEEILATLRRRDPEAIESLIGLLLQQTAESLISFLNETE